MFKLERAQLRYQPYYCEENIWQLCREPALSSYSRLVIVISNLAQTCALWGQKAAPEGEPVIWDYHVIMAVYHDKWWVCDLDTRWDFPCSAQAYLAQTFRPVAPQFAPYFKVVDATVYAQTLASDRSHMRFNNSWTHPPPPWAPPGPGMNLPQFWDMSRPFGGELMDLQGLSLRLTSSPPTP